MAQWLCGDGWNSTWADKLAAKYDVQKDILTPTDTLLDFDEESEIWDESLERSRGFQTLLVVDTCALLDLLQSPFRLKNKHVLQDMVTSANVLIEEAEKPTAHVALAPVTM